MTFSDGGQQCVVVAADPTSPVSVCEAGPARPSAATGKPAHLLITPAVEYFALFRNLRTFDPDRHFYAWFYVLLRNRCFKQRSRRGTRSESGIVPPPGVDPGVSEEQLDLWRAIDRLPPDDAELVVLKHIEGWTYEELSKALNVPRGTVMSRLSVARQRLMRLLSGERS